MNVHYPVEIWQERPGEYSWKCACNGWIMKHQTFGTWLGCGATRDA